MEQQFRDKKIRCSNESCEFYGQEFTWTAEEQEFFAAKGFHATPDRCKACRAPNLRAMLIRDSKKGKEHK